MRATSDSSLSMNYHIKAVVKVCNSQLRSISQVRTYLTGEAIEKVLHAFVSSHFDNGNSLLYGLHDYRINCLQRMQNIAARICTKTKKFKHISQCNQITILAPCCKCIEYKIIILTFKCMPNLAPTYLKELLVPYVPIVH